MFYVCLAGCDSYFQSWFKQVHFDQACFRVGGAWFQPVSSHACHVPFSRIFYKGLKPKNLNFIDSTPCYHSWIPSFIKHSEPASGTSIQSRWHSAWQLLCVREPWGGGYSRKEDSHWKRLRPTKRCGLSSVGEKLWNTRLDSARSRLTNAKNRTYIISKINNL